MKDRAKLEDQVDEGKSYLTQQIIPRNPSVFLTMGVTASVGSAPKGGLPTQTWYLSRKQVLARKTSSSLKDLLSPKQESKSHELLFPSGLKPLYTYDVKI